MDRNGGLVLVPACKGRLTINRLSAIYNGKIERNSIICTDSHNAYKAFAREIPADLIQLDSGTHKKGVYHINHINSLHSRLKEWVKDRKGISTKYLANYMYWFNWVERNKSISKYKQSRNMIYESISAPLSIMQTDISATVPF